jgi:uncharacterized protein with HEPN domain
MSERDKSILQHIIRYCTEIDDANDQFGNSLSNLKTNSVYKNAVSMCILQIGELVVLLSDEFKAIYDEMPWRDIKSMRNIAAHQYHRFDLDTLWETITEDIPNLRAYCDSIIRINNVSEKDG